MTTRIVFAAAVLGLLAFPLAASAQGVVRGAREGAATGHRAAGPVGGAVGGAVGGVAGGVVGGVKGVLGIPQNTGTTRRSYRKQKRVRR
jgi:phage tail tape-measure protein